MDMLTTGSSTVFWCPAIMFHLLSFCGKMNINFMGCVFSFFFVLFLLMLLRDAPNWFISYFSKIYHYTNVRVPCPSWVRREGESYPWGYVKVALGRLLVYPLAFCWRGKWQYCRPISNGGRKTSVQMRASVDNTYSLIAFIVIVLDVYCSWKLL
jgi:hypothetical protein